MSTLLDEQSLKDIHEEDIRAYLLQKGWQEMRYADSRLQVFVNRNVEGEPALLMLPVSRKLSDFYPRLVDALAVLAKVEQLPIIGMLQKIRTANDDVIRLRLTLPPDQNPSIDLTAQLLQGFLDLVIFSASMEVVEKTRYFKRSPDAGKQEAQRFQFCHTYPGSFGFAMASPLVEHLFPEENPPVGRRIVERITRGLLTMQEAEKQQDSSQITRQYQDGLNGNMCYAVAHMIENLRETQIEYSVDWSPRLRAPQDVAYIPSISLNSSSAVYLQQAGDHLKETADPGSEDLGERDIHGKVTELIRPEEDKNDNRSRRYVIIASHHYNQDIKVSLAEADYRQACDAHRDQRPVSIRGRLIRKKKGNWLLLNAHDLIVR